jgi:cholestenol delta-isomerase
MFGNGTASSMLSEAPHPFYPIGVEIAGYLANDKDHLTLLGIALAGLAVICSATWTIVSVVSPGLRTRDKLIILWFMSSRFLFPQTYSAQANALSLAGTIHFFFEGYFAINHTRMAPATDIFGQMWKEYANSDSRYLTSDPFVLCMETVTAVGPS